MRPVARLLAGREARALVHLSDRARAGLAWPAARTVPGECIGRRGSLPARSFLDGVPLVEAQRVALDYFERLKELVAELHAAGVCHNDLHKEQNVLVGPDGRPALIDFQLASVHRTESRVFRSRRADDLRHVAKMRARYERAGRPQADGAPRRRRGGLAWVWRTIGKPLYNAVVHGLLGKPEGERGRPDAGPWPERSGELGPWV
jgi:RIO-like serine/threonine protein kinase